MAVWIENPSVDNFKLCVQETKIFDGLHQNIKIVSNNNNNNNNNRLFIDIFQENCYLQVKNCCLQVKSKKRNY